MDEVDEILNQNPVVDDVDEDEKEDDEDDEMLAEVGGEEAAVQEDDDEDDEEDDDDDNDEDEDDDDDEEDDEDDDDEDDDEDDDDEDDDEGNGNENENKNDDEDRGEDAEMDVDLQQDESDQDDQKNDDEQSKLDKIHNYYTQMIISARLADSYTIYPTAAIPIQTHVNTMTMSKGLGYLFLGGSDGYIRKYDFRNTVEGKLSLTILQKHSLADSIQNAGILSSYWENEIPQKRSELKMAKNNKEYDPVVSAVYSLEVQSECLFLLSGLENGGVTMQGVRYGEGSVAHYFKGRNGHSQTVNFLKLNNDESKFLSGSWDKRILEWDLQSGNIVNEFNGLQSQLSSMEMRPLYSTVDINEVAAKLKSEQTKGDKDDDDMDSLFGDDDEPNETTNTTGEAEEKSEEKSEDLPDEISKTTLNTVYDDSVFMTSGLNGSIELWDRRTTSGPVLNFTKGSGIPPWCLSACWSMDGDRIFAGRRNALVEEFDLKMTSKPLSTIKFPSLSGSVSCVRAMPNNKHILCASQDNIRLYNMDNNASFNSSGQKSTPFFIVPGHHGGVISNLYIDPTSRFLISTSGNRGWQGISTDTTLIYEIDLE